ncbi:MAG: GNAT family N-acetyltransferase [Pseudomonadota bacterium]
MLVLKTYPHPLELRTKRTLLRQWKDSDLPAWCAMNADPEVRRYFPSVHTEEEARGEAERIRAALVQRGWGFWALELPGKLPFAGCVGLLVPAFEAHFTPAVEIGWRLPREAWGFGYASEAARAAAEFAFTHLEVDEIVAITTPANAPSRKVMERLGMWHDAAGDFDHPRLPAGHPMQRHVLYRLDRARFRRHVTNPNALLP